MLKLDPMDGVNEFQKGYVTSVSGRTGNLRPSLYGRSGAGFLQQMQNPGDMRGTTLTLTNLQYHDQSLETGALFEHGGYVKITQANIPHPAGTSGTGQVGSVSVTIG